MAKQCPSAVEHSGIGFSELQQTFSRVTLLDVSLHRWPVCTPKYRDIQPHSIVEGARCTVGCLEHTLDYQRLEADHVQSLRITKFNHRHRTVDLTIRKLEKPTFTIGKGVVEMVSLEMSETKVGE